jgi:hypothetical protein
MSTKIDDVIWQTKDGTRIRLGDVTDSHLQNIIQHLEERRARFQAEADAAASYGGSPDGMAAYYADCAMDQAFDKVWKTDRWLELMHMMRRRRAVKQKPVAILTNDMKACMAELNSRFVVLEWSRSQARGLVRTNDGTMIEVRVVRLVEHLQGMEISGFWVMGNPAHPWPQLDEMTRVAQTRVR